MAEDENPFDACPDGGRCWHGCTIVDGKGLPCWRVAHAAPFTNHYPDEPDGYWPDEVRRAHGVQVEEKEPKGEPLAFRLTCTHEHGGQSDQAECSRLLAEQIREAL